MIHPDPRAREAVLRLFGAHDDFGNPARRSLSGFPADFRYIGLQLAWDGDGASERGAGESPGRSGTPWGICFSGDTTAVTGLEVPIQAILFPSRPMGLASRRVRRSVPALSPAPGSLLGQAPASMQFRPVDCGTT